MNKLLFLFSLQPLTNHTKLLLNSSLYKEPVDPAKWFGIRKDATALGYSKVCLMLPLPSDFASVN